MMSFCFHKLTFKIILLELVRIYGLLFNIFQGFRSCDEVIVLLPRCDLRVKCIVQALCSCTYGQIIAILEFHCFPYRNQIFLKQSEQDIFSSDKPHQDLRKHYEMISESDPS